MLLKHGWKKPALSDIWLGINGVIGLILAWGVIINDVFENPIMEIFVSGFGGGFLAVASIYVLRIFLESICYPPFATMVESQIRLLFSKRAREVVKDMLNTAEIMGVNVVAIGRVKVNGRKAFYIRWNDDKAFSDEDMHVWLEDNGVTVMRANCGCEILHPEEHTLESIINFTQNKTKLEKRPDIGEMMENMLRLVDDE